MIFLKDNKKIRNKYTSFCRKNHISRHNKKSKENTYYFIKNIAH